MTIKRYRFEVAEARSFHHPVFKTITKHTYLVQASKLPVDMPTGANARDPVGLSRRVYKEVRESLKGNEAIPGSFDLMNLGITVIADRVVAVEKGVFDVMIDDAEGIVNGAHTASIIGQCQNEGSIPDEQYVEVRIITGIKDAGYNELNADIAKGQNTGITVKDQSIYDIQNIFEGIRDITKDQLWAEDIAWRESDKGNIDVRELISTMEVFNVIDFPNGDGNHPIQAYEKYSVPLTKYADDHKLHSEDLSKRKYAAFEPLLLDALDLYDRIRHDFRDVFNEKISSGAGRMRILEEAKPNQGAFAFPYSGQANAKYRLTKGAAFPLLAAFRNCVVYDEVTHKAEWWGGYANVKQLWADTAPELVRETYNATREIGRQPDVLGKSRSHWAALYRTLENRVLRAQLGSTNNPSSGLLV
jgi:hypothetical protein